MPSLERQGCRCQNASRQRGAKTHRRQRGGSGSPSRRGTHGGQAARQRHGVAKAGRVADGGAGEERGPTLEPAADAGAPGAPWLRSSTSAHAKAKASGRAPRRQTWLAPGEGAVTEGKRMSAMPSPRTTPTPACCSAPLKDPGCAQQHPCAQGCPLCTNTMRTNLPQGPRPPAPIACRSRGRGSAPGTPQHPALRTSASPWGGCEARQEEPSHPIPSQAQASLAGLVSSWPPHSQPVHCNSKLEEQLCPFLPQILGLNTAPCLRGTDHAAARSPKRPMEKDQKRSLQQPGGTATALPPHANLPGPPFMGG
ncbi:uncharacterized protein LOC143165543 [Aptenodytes patagonicus]|uniref:uncharacterized protein LOC143165543 n=1 Tax=Aptenodytes patagonicus TaxID=9234 RepID=UPI003FA0B331